MMTSLPLADCVHLFCRPPTPGMPRKLTKFISEPPALVCPVCQRIFSEPVISVKCGHTFCRSCIENMVCSGTQCPIDGVECDTSQLVLNRAVIGQVDDLLIYCCHGLLSHDGGLTCERDQTGCSEVIKFGGRDHHEEVCEYSRVMCPVGGEQCGLIRRRDLECHLTKCSQVPCPFSDFGLWLHVLLYSHLHVHVYVSWCELR